MADLRTVVADVLFKNPVIAASGTYGFGEDFTDFYPLSTLGGISCKGTTLDKRLGNKPPRITQTHSGIINSVGLQNPGINHFIEIDLPKLKNEDIVVISNIAGSSIDEYCAITEKLSMTNVDMIELNISCPNVKKGGLSFGTNPNSVHEITEQVKRRSSKPVIVKLSPNVSDIGEIARAAEGGGADAVSLINTLTGMVIDINTKKPVLKNNTGGLSGPAIKPLAVRMVYEAAQSVSIPVIGMGGIETFEDAIEIMLAGASLIQVGSANFTDVYAMPKIIEGINKYLDDFGYKNASDIVGKVELW